MPSDAVVALVVIVIGWLVVVPALGIVALVRVSSLKRLLDASRGAGAAGQAHDRRLAAIEARVAWLEGRLAPPADSGVAVVDPVPAIEAPAVEMPAPEGPPVASSAAASRPHEPKPAAPVAASGRGLDLEALIAGRWLHYVGLFLVFVASAFFLKLVIDSGWIGPAEQVAIGIVVGVALLALGGRMFAQGAHIFSDGATALGAGVLYLSLWAGTVYYEFWSSMIGLLAMVGVTVVQAALAHRRSRQRLAVLALIGGFLTPAISGGSGGTTNLLVYLAILNVGLLALAWTRGWRALAPLAFVFTWMYFGGRYDCCRQSDDVGVWMAFASVFFVMFALIPALRARFTARLHAEDVAVTLINASLYLLTLRDLWWPDRLWPLTVAVVALAALHLAVARAVPKAPTGDWQQASVLYAGLALFFATIVVPIQLSGPWLTIAWAIEAGILMWIGFGERILLLRGAAFVLFGILTARLLALPIAADGLLLNPRFAAFAATVAAAVWAVLLWRRSPEVAGERERPLFGALAIAANVLALWVLSIEVYDALAAPAGTTRTAMTPYRFAQQLGLSLLWTAYAVGLMIAGIRRTVASLRWQALVLLGAVVLKVLVIDMSFLQGAYRVVSSIVLGVVLLLVSLRYQRRAAARTGGEPRGPE